MLYISLFGSFAVIEGLIGFSHINVHIVRDFLNFVLMICALLFSSKALQLSQKPKDEDFNYGYRRFNILAAFINSVYLVFTFIFDFVDILHHSVEHWEVESHDHTQPGEKPQQPQHESKNLSKTHDDEAHIMEMNFYLALFSFLRLLIIMAYLYLESKHFPVHDYLQTNWLNWPSPNNKSALKAKIKQCQQWDSFRMNLYSVTLLMGCEFLNNLGNIWIFYVCVNFGMLENALSLLKGIAMVVITIPLFLDISYILL